MTPYPTGRTPSRERGSASQGGKTFRMMKGFWGTKLSMETKGVEDKEQGPKRHKPWPIQKFMRSHQKVMRIS